MTRTPGFNADDEQLAAIESRVAALGPEPLPASFDQDLRAAIRVNAVSRRWRRIAGLAALVGLITGLGGSSLWSRARTPAAVPDGRAEFMLIFDEQVAGRVNLDANARRVRGDEMNAWVAMLRDGRHLVSGRKLRDEAGLRAAVDRIDDRRGEVPSGLLTSGFVIIRAADYAEAGRLAQASPIVAHGGSIAVRALQ